MPELAGAEIGKIGAHGLSCKHIAAGATSAPDKMIVPSKKSRTSLMRAKGLRSPPWPPAPAQTRIKPSTPASAALRACFKLVTS